MKTCPAVTCLFLDIGGVLLSNGWDHVARRRAVAAFKLDGAEVEKRHRLTFETYELGRLTLNEYLSLVIFHEQRSFSMAEFRRFMFAQSTPRSEMLTLVAALKARHRLKIIVVSNEAREINAHRIRTFKLDRLVDAFISSCFVHVRKPDQEIFRLALDVAHTPAREVLYIDNTSMFIEIAKGLGIRGILHTDYASTRGALASSLKSNRTSGFGV